LRHPSLLSVGSLSAKVGLEEKSGARMWLGRWRFCANCQVAPAAHFYQNPNDINEPSAIGRPASHFA
jgi:hypothetical protein